MRYTYITFNEGSKRGQPLFVLGALLARLRCSEANRSGTITDVRSTDLINYRFWVKMAKKRKTMSEDSSIPLRTSGALIPQKRPIGLEDEQHVPAVSSPLNPDFANSRTRKQPAREQREKKESLKKREAKGVEGARNGTPDAQSQGKRLKKSTQTTSTLSPIRYKLAAPKSTDFDPPRAPVFTHVDTRAQRNFYETSEQ